MTFQFLRLVNRDHLPLRVKSVSRCVDAKQFVGVGDSVQVRPLSVEEVRVRFPDLVQHLDARTQLRYVALRNECQPVVFPHLTEVAVHGKHLLQSVHRQDNYVTRLTGAKLI